MKCNSVQSPNQEVWSQGLKLRFNTWGFISSSKGQHREEAQRFLFILGSPVLVFIQVLSQPLVDAVKTSCSSLVFTYSSPFWLFRALQTLLASNNRQLPVTPPHTEWLCLFFQIISYANIPFLFSSHFPVSPFSFVSLPHYSSPHIFPLCICAVVMLLSITIPLPFVYLGFSGFSPTLKLYFCTSLHL